MTSQGLLYNSENEFFGDFPSLFVVEGSQGTELKLLGVVALGRARNSQKVVPKTGHGIAFPSALVFLSSGDPRSNPSRISNRAPA